MDQPDYFSTSGAGWQKRFPIDGKGLHALIPHRSSKNRAEFAVETQIQRRQSSKWAEVELNSVQSWWGIEKSLQCQFALWQSKQCLVRIRLTTPPLPTATSCFSHYWTAKVAPTLGFGQMPKVFKTGLVDEILVSLSHKRCYKTIKFRDLSVRPRTVVELLALRSRAISARALDRSRRENFNDTARTRLWETCVRECVVLPFCLERSHQKLRLK